MNSSKFIVAGPLYPDRDDWPSNVIHREHIAPSDHRQFYCSQRFTLNLTRADMVQAGYAPSVRLFEASACGIPIISDYWDGIEEFFKADEEILISKSAEDTIHYLNTISDSQRIAIGEKARKRVLVSHTAAQRAKELESYIQEAFRMKGKSNIITSQIVNK
jgi:spore maturation protein CgeB